METAGMILYFVMDHTVLLKRLGLDAVERITGILMTFQIRGGKIIYD